MAQPSSARYSLAAIASVLAASTCCLPLGVLSLAAGAAGASAFLAEARPYLIALSIALIAFGFWRALRAGQCDRRQRIWSLALLWASAAFVAIGLLFPQVLAGLVTGTVPGAPAGQPPATDFDLARFEAQFNQAPGRRLVVLLSPT